MVPETDVTGGVSRRQTFLWLGGRIVMLFTGGFSKYLHFNIVRVDKKTVGAVMGNRYIEPVFLKPPKSEAFYIRNGPSSGRLPVSEVLTYIKHRK
jgi:hypothetical protein